MRGEAGTSGIEYAMIVALIAVVVVVAAGRLGPGISSRLTEPFARDGATTTTVTVLGETLTREECSGREHAHKGCK